MKKILLSILTIIAFSFGANAQNVNIPDANFKAYLVGNTAINTNNDAEIQVSEASAFTGQIYCNALSISDLTGIEAFTALTVLRCYSNSLSSLDVSNNTALTELRCYNNSLSSLDVSNNTALTELLCYGNPLGSLDVSNNTALTELRCYSNSLSSLDVSNNTALTQLNCYNNSLSSLDVANNTALTFLNCGINSLSSLDVSNNTALTWLECPANPLSSLDVSNNADLVILICNNSSLSSLDVSNNAALDRLYCHFNSLSSLDVSNNIDLTQLRCNDNSLSSLNVSNNSDLTELYCQNNSLSILDVSNGNNTNFTYFYATNNPTLTCIQVDNAAYSTTNWTSIDAGASFSTNCNYPCTVNIPDANFKAYLVGNTAINTNNDTEIQCSEASAFTGAINCSNQSISDLTGIEAFTALTFLWCNNNSLSNLDVTQNIALTVLRCNNNPLTSLDVTQNTELTQLTCYLNSLTSLDVTQNTALTSLFCNNNSLTSLDVTQNTALNVFFTEVNYLSSLDLTQNTALVQLGCDNNSLTSLNVANGNNINSTYFTAINNPNLTCIQVDDVAWSTTNWTAIDAQTSFSTNCGTVNINELNNTSMSISPNPVKNYLNITLSEKVNKISLYNINGSLIQTINIIDNKIDVSHLSQGMYILVIQSDKGVSQNKFIKE